MKTTPTTTTTTVEKSKGVTDNPADLEQRTHNDNKSLKGLNVKPTTNSVNSRVSLSASDKQTKHDEGKVVDQSKQPGTTSDDRNRPSTRMKISSDQMGRLRRSVNDDDKMTTKPLSDNKLHADEKKKKVEVEQKEDQVSDEPIDDESLMEDISTKLRNLLRIRQRNNNEFDSRQFIEEIIRREMSSKEGKNIDLLGLKEARSTMVSPIGGINQNIGVAWEKSPSESMMKKRSVRMTSDDESSIRFAQQQKQLGAHKTNTTQKPDHANATDSNKLFVDASSDKSKENIKIISGVHPTLATIVPNKRMNLSASGELDWLNPFSSVAHSGVAPASSLHNSETIGAAAVGFLFLFLLFIYFVCCKWCCCCFKSKSNSTLYNKHQQNNSSNSNSNNKNIGWLSSKLTSYGQASGKASASGFKVSKRAAYDDSQSISSGANPLNKHKDLEGQTSTSASTGCLTANSRFDHIPTWANSLHKSSSFNNTSSIDGQFGHENPSNNMKSLMKFRNKNDSSQFDVATTKKSSKQEEQKLGRIKFKIDYDFNTNVLSVNLIEACNLAAMDLCGSSDPYVKVFLLPDKKHYEKTRVHKKTLNPQFNETFQFRINYADVVNRTLLLVVYDHDRFSRHDTIGQATIPMNSLDLSVTREEWRDLKPHNDSNGSLLGDICLSLRYVPTAGKLNVVVCEARRLKKMDLAGLSDPYVKISLMSNGKRIKKKKTSVKKCTLNPHYNESFTFEIPFERIQQVQMVFTVVDYDRLGQSEPIGKIVLGCDCTTGDSERRHWMDMLGSPRRPITQWHSLKDYSNDTTSNNNNNNNIKNLTQ